MLILEKRESRYSAAELTVQTDTKRIGSTVEELTRKINRYIRQADLYRQKKQSDNHADK